MSKKSRWLLQTLILSVALNVALVGIFFYFLIRENPLQFSYKPTSTSFIEIDSTYLQTLKSFSFEQLVDCLNDQKMIEKEYRVCDFALAALQKFHDFDVCRALNDRILPEKKWIFEGDEFTFFPNLSDKEYALLINFAKKELYPFTYQGLLKILQSGVVDRELCTYFCHTQEFLLLETLFTRTNLPIQKGALLAMLKEGGFERFERFVQAQKIESDFSDRLRQALLLDYIDCGSKTAAYFLLITDHNFAINDLNDDQIVQVLHLLDVKTQEAITFAEVVLSSSRSEETRECAFRRVAEYRGEDVSARFTPRPSEGVLRPNFRQKPPMSLSSSVHVIQPGESLWLIAKKYNVSIESLMQNNRLQSTVLQPGKTLKIVPSS